MSYLPCGKYFESYQADQNWWRTPFIKGKMLLMVIVLLLFPFAVGREWVSVANQLSYYTLAALGVQLLIGYCGQITLGHAAFVAVGGYCSAMMVLFFPWPAFLQKLGLAYPISIVCAGVLAGFWSVLFGLPSARVKGFYLIMTTMAAQWITLKLVITQYVSQIGGRGQAFSIEPGKISVGPFLLDADTELAGWVINSDVKIYYFGLILVALCLVAMGNLLRSRTGRAWIAIRDNDIAAETMGVNIVGYKLRAFFVAGFFGGIAGAFWITTSLSVSPELYEWYYSLLWVGVILIGGVGSIQGVVFGSAFIVLLFKFLEIAVHGVSDYLDEPGASGLLTWIMVNLPWVAAKLRWMLSKIEFFRESAVGLAIIFFLIYEPNGLSYRYWQLKNYFNLWPFSYHGK
jgi:branched-chain amino acid transport system permease protein